MRFEKLMNLGPLIICAPIIIGYPIVAGMPPHDPVLWWVCYTCAVVCLVFSIAMTVKMFREFK